MFGHVRSSKWISSRISQVRSSHVYPDPSRASPQFLRSVSSQALINGLPRALRHILIAGLLWIALTDLTLAESGGLTALGFRVFCWQRSDLCPCCRRGWFSGGAVVSIETSFERARFLRAVVEGTSDAVFVKDRDGKYLLVNTAGAQFIGKQVSEVLGRVDRELFRFDGR